MTLHDTPSEYAGKTIIIKPHTASKATVEFYVVDWADRVYGMSWEDEDHALPEIQQYSYRGYMAAMQLPEEQQWDVDDEVLYGHLISITHEEHGTIDLTDVAEVPVLFHISEVKV